MHKKTYTTEFAALFSVAFAIYQGHKSGVINPDLIGQMFLHSYEVATIIFTTAFALGRKIYTKYLRNPKSVKASKILTPDEIERLYMERYSAFSLDKNPGHWRDFEVIKKDKKNA